MILARRQFLRLSTAVALATVPAPAWPLAYPARPVRVIVPFGPGGPTDIAARLIAQKLTETLGKQFYVENIGGAGGNIGTGQAAKTAPDGHTILITAPTYVVNPNLFASVPYDPNKDFVAVTLAVTAPTILTVHPSVEAATVDELVALIRRSPGKFSYASPGPGTPPHLLGELFRMSFGLDLTHIPYNSGGLAIGATVGGHTPISFGALPPAVPHVKGGKLRAIAVTSRTRTDALPDVPSMPEAGYPDIVADIWTGVFVPFGTPDAVVARLHREIEAIVALPDVKARMSSLGFAPLASSPDATAKEIKSEMAKWAKVIRESGIRIR